MAVKMGQAKHLGKHEAAAQMIRLVADLMTRLEEDNEMTIMERMAAGDVLNTFLLQQPKSVQRDVLQG